MQKNEIHFISKKEETKEKYPIGKQFEYNNKLIGFIGYFLEKEWKAFFSTPTHAYTIG